MRNHCLAVAFLAFAAAASLLISPVGAVDTDGDGLLDLIDVPGFNPSAGATPDFSDRGIQDLDGANLLTNLQSLFLAFNQITSIDSGDFDGLDNLHDLYLYENRITSIESGGFEGLDNLQQLSLAFNQITS
ncbi:MAG: leucine-rich repeat domain-containing protein, partial [Planctomycetales bacterium]|nr:leucine-rich repeat domain-containing protein [Planctomycetales bacterium]